MISNSGGLTWVVNLVIICMVKDLPKKKSGEFHEPITVILLSFLLMVYIPPCIMKVMSCLILTILDERSLKEDAAIELSENVCIWWNVTIYYFLL